MYIGVPVSIFNIYNRLDITWRITEIPIGWNVMVGGGRWWINITQNFPLILRRLLVLIDFRHIHVSQILAVFPMLMAAGIQLCPMINITENVKINTRRFILCRCLNHLHFILEIDGWAIFTSLIRFALSLKNHLKYE